MTESVIRYRPGTLRAVVSPRGVAVLPDTIDSVLLDRIWHDLDSGLGLGAVLESLTGAFGTSLTLIPPFAVVTFADSPDDADARIAVRGDLTIEVAESGSDSPVTVSGADVTTWSERVLRAPRALAVRSTAPASGDEEFGVASGVVLVSGVSVAFTSEGATTPAPTLAPPPPAPAPAVDEPAPAPAPAPAPFVVPPVAEPPAPFEPPAAFDAPETAAPETAAPEAPASEHADVPEETLVVDEHAADSAVEAAAEPVDLPVPVESVPAVTPAAEPEGAAAPTSEDDVAAQPSDLPEGSDVPEATMGELPDDAYDHLWGETVVKSVETAAVREVEEEDEEAAAPPAAPAPAPVASPEPEPAAAPEPAGAPEPASLWTAPPPTGLIDSVPGFGAVGVPSPVSAAPAPSASPASAPSASPLPAPVSAAHAASAGGAGNGADTDTDTDTGSDGDHSAADHDGLTVTVSELEAMRRLAESAPAEQAPSAGLGRIVMSTGETHPLDRPVIIGRRPRANRVQGDSLPLLLTVESPEQDISRNHLEIRLEGRHVLVADMHTTNGSVLHREGTPPLRLSPDDAVLVLTGDLVDLGDGVTVRFEEIP